jgi:hypothetical protein
VREQQHELTAPWNDDDEVDERRREAPACDV